MEPLLIIHLALGVVTSFSWRSAREALSRTAPRTCASGFDQALRRPRITVVQCEFDPPCNAGTNAQMCGG